MRTGVLLLGIYPPPRMISLAQLAEDLGFDTLWHGDDKFYRDTAVELALCAVHTERLELGTGVVEPYTRHPVLTAGMLATLDEVSDGRVVAGLGAGGSGFEAMGIDRAKPVRRVREAVEVMRAVWTGNQVVFDGETMRFHGKLRFHAPRPGIPIVIGTRGRLLLELAGEIADGVMISTCSHPPAIREAMSHVSAGAQRVGRSQDDLRMICRLECCISDDAAQARQAVKPMLVASLKSSYPNWQFLRPVGLVVPDAIRDAIVSGDRGRIAAVAATLPDEFAEKLALCGTPTHVADQIREIAKLGIGEIAIYPIPLENQHVEEQITGFQSAVHAVSIPNASGIAG